MKYTSLSVFAALCLGVLASCSSDPAPTTTKSAMSPQAVKGAVLFKDNACYTCHGEKGAGDGMLSKTLTPPPRNYTDKAWQASTTDEHIKNVIKKGGEANGLSATMAPYEKQITNEADYDALVAYIRYCGQ